MLRILFQLGWLVALVFASWRASAGTERVVINEIHFDPPGKRPLEFVELHNPNTNEVSLFGWSLGKFAFTTVVNIAPGGYLVVARDPAVFAKEFGFTPLGPLPMKLKHHDGQIE